MNDPVLFDIFVRLGLALAIGFLVGVERGWKRKDDPDESRVAGVRTHAIMGLLGGVSALIGAEAGPTVLAALTLAFIIPFAAFKYRETVEDGDLSATGVIAGLLVFALGIYAVEGDVRVAAAAGVALTALLAFKQALHAWVRALTWPEIQSAVFILAASAIALPLLPDTTFDPWRAINPRELWELTILVAGISFAGYVAVRVLGAERGMMTSAAVGALVSSTVVTAELARGARGKKGRAAPAAAAAALAATVSLIRVGVLVAIGAAPALTEVAPALGGGALGFLMSAFALHWLGRGDGENGANKTLQNPLELKSVLLFGFFLGLVIVLGRMAQHAFGQVGLLPFAAIAGVADADAVTLAAGSLIRNGLGAGVGAHAVLVAVLVNTISKGVIGALAGGWRFMGFYFAAAALAVVLAAAGWFFAASLFPSTAGALPG